MMGIGFPELMIILVIIMIIFGAGKLPEIGSAFGRSIKNFKSSMKEAEEADGDGDGEATTTASVDGDAESAPPASTSETSTPAPVSQAKATPTEAVTPKTTAPKTTTAKKSTGLSAEDQKEQDIIDEAIKELEGKRIDTIKTRHDGLVQERDVFTESLKRTPFGRGRDRGVQRDVF
jgi:sec-independent protein translocase protein TatA